MKNTTYVLQCMLKISEHTESLVVVFKALFIAKSLRPLRAWMCYSGVRIPLEVIRLSPYQPMYHCLSQPVVHQILEFHAPHHCASVECQWEYWMKNHGQLIPYKSTSNSTLSLHMQYQKICFSSTPKIQLNSHDLLLSFLMGHNKQSQYFSPIRHRGLVHPVVFCNNRSIALPSCKAV